MENVQLKFLINNDISCLYSVSIYIFLLKINNKKELLFRGIHFRFLELRDHILKPSQGLQVQEIRFFF